MSTPKRSRAEPWDSPGGVMVLRPPPVRSDSQGFRLVSDTHLGCSHTDEGLLLSELEDARGRGDRVLINGDVFDLILPRDKKRYQPSAVHPLLRGSDDLVNRVVKHAFDLLEPFADLIDFVGVGNHETKGAVGPGACDPVGLLVDKLNAALGEERVSHGGYSGFCLYRFAGSKRPAPFTVYYHHGWGGGGKITDAAKDFYALAHVEGADVLWLGHRHARMNASVQRLGPPRNGGCHPETREVRFVRTGSYMRPWRGQTREEVRAHGRKGNYVADGGCSPSGVGGARLVVSLTDDRKGYDLVVEQ